MAGFVLYETITKKQLKTAIKDSISGISKWFKNNPKRKVCTAEWVYGETYKVRRDHVEEDVMKIANKTKTK